MTAEVIEFNRPDATDPRIVGVSIEAKLQEWSLPYTYDPAFDITTLDHVDYTQVRDIAGRVDPEQADEYRRQMQNGAVFPPIVIMHGKLLVDGNTRVDAAMKLRGRDKTLPAFNVSFPSAPMARAFAASMNQRNGRRLSSLEAKNAALALIECGFAETVIALEVGYSRQQIGKWKSQQRFAEALDRAGQGDIAEQLTTTAQQELGVLKSDPVVVEAAKVIAAAHAPQTHVRELVKAVKATNSEAEALEAIAAVRGGWAVAGHPAKPQVPAGLRQFRMSVGKIVDSTAGDFVETDPARRDVSREQWRRLSVLAGEVLGIYEASGV